MIKVGTDISGIGSPEQALIKLGIKHQSIFACDYDKYAKQSYLANYNTETFYDDITKRDHTKTPYVDLYVAGFPCQAFSLAGKRSGFSDTRGTLFFDLLQYLKAKRPKYFILENVKGLMSRDKGKTFITILDALSKTINSQYYISPYEDSLGYYVYYKVLNTKDYGIPQNRERIFIVGFRDEKHSFKFPKKTPLELKLKDILQDNPDSKYNLSDERIKKINAAEKLKNKTDNDLIKVHCLQQRSENRPAIKKNKNSGGTGHLSKQDGTSYCLDAGNSQAIEVADKYYLSDKAKAHATYTGKKKGAVINLNRGGQMGVVYSKDTDIMSCLTAVDYKNPKKILEVDKKYYLSDKAVETLETYNDRNKSKGNGFRAKFHNPEQDVMSSLKVGGKGADDLVEGKRIRRLTPLECLRLQGFPDSFHNKCIEEGLSDTQLYRQAGNSMTVDVMAYLIKEILINES